MLGMASRARGGAPRGVERRRATGGRIPGTVGTVDGGRTVGNVDGGRVLESVDRDGGRDGVAEIQRTRLIAALVEVAAERGVADLTVANVVARVGVSRRTFYELFEGREDCFLAAFDLAVERAAQRVLPAYDTPGAWRERIRAGLGALLEFLEDEPGLAGLCVVDALGAGPRAIARRAQVVNALIDAVHEGHRETKGSVHPTRLTAEGVVGAILAVLHARLTSGPAWGSSRGQGSLRGQSPPPGVGAPSIVDLLGPLMGMIVLPYQGQAAAAREASRPAPARRQTVHPHSDPLRTLDIRLTYRTVRVLLAIAGRPGVSNRQVADAAGVVDQGQISKLLARLERRGLIRNEGAGPASGEPNAWSLTPKGEEMERTIGRQAVPATG